MKRSLPLKITAIGFSYRSYASTNPPRDISNLTEFYEEYGGNYRIKTCNFINGLEITKIYAVEKEKAGEITALFESLGITDDVAAKLRGGPDPVMPPVTGGSESHGFSFTANGIRVDCNYIPSCAQTLCEKIKEITAQCGEPVSEKTAGEDRNAKYYAGLGIVPVEGAPGFTAQTDTAPASGPPLSEGEWFCPLCGNRNTGAFCSECGNLKQIKGE